jgi:hypothetical protein
MSFSPRLRLPRRRQPTLRFESLEHDWFVFTPDPEHPLVVRDFADAVTLALDLTDLPDLPVEHEALVLLDEQRRITAMLLDAPGEVSLFVGRAAVPGTEMPFCQTLCIELHRGLYDGPPRADDRRGYQSLRRVHMAQGLLLLDVLLTDGDGVRSLAIGCDPDPVWFDPLYVGAEGGAGEGSERSDTP